MSLTRRRFSLAAASVGLSLPTALAALAQDGLNALPEGALRDQIEWFLGVINGTGGEVIVEEVEAHFTDAFLAQVSAGQVLGTIEAMRPSLGTVSIDRISPGSTEHDAGVALVGETGLRMRLTISIEPESGLIQGLMIQPDTSSAGTAATAVAATTGTPATVASPPATGEILADYQSAVEELTAAGRALTASFLAGDDTAVVGSFSEFVADLLVGFSAEDGVRAFTTDIVSFSIAEVSAHFVGHYTPEGITGHFHQGTPAAFHLVPHSPQTGDVPAGLWTGDIIIGTYTLGIEVDFTGTEDALGATISIPEQGLRDHPLASVVFERERPLGVLVDERALPLGPSMGTTSYGALYEWGPDLLAINSAFDEAGDALGVSAVMQVVLPDDPMGSTPVATTFQLPFDGAWMVIWGGGSEFRNYHAPTPQQRSAHDIVIWRDGATYRGDGTRNEDYHCYGQPQYAPAAGTVVIAVDEYPDDTPGTTPTADPTMHPAGNHVVIEVADGEYVLMAHFQPGTVAVSAGDTVAAGDLVGLTGNSGNSSEPHVHIHLQTGPDMFDPGTFGLPMTFTGLRVNGEGVEPSTIEQGQIVERA
jgi:hypothetical protein